MNCPPLHPFRCSIVCDYIGKEYKPKMLATSKANADKFPGGIWKVKTDWGESSGKIGEAYWVLYGIKADGTPDVNILTKTEKSYQDYIVCDENGNDIGALSEIDPA